MLRFGRSLELRGVRPEHAEVSSVHIDELLGFIGHLEHCPAEISIVLLVFMSHDHQQGCPDVGDADLGIEGLACCEARDRCFVGPPCAEACPVLDEPAIGRDAGDEGRAAELISRDNG